MVCVIKTGGKKVKVNFTSFFYSLFCFPFSLFLLFSIILWLLYFDEGSITRVLVIFEPGITRSRGSVHCSLDITKEWLPLLARSIASPPVLSVLSNLIMECMVHLKYRQILSDGRKLRNHSFL